MRANIDRRPRRELFAELDDDTSPSTLVLPSLVIDIQPDGRPAPTNGTGSSAAPPAGPIKVKLRGEMDALTAGRSAEFLESLLDGCSPSMVIDLAGLTFCDASGLGAFVRLANMAEAAGGHVALTGVRPMLAKQLRITGLDRRFAALE
ncbi:MAG TPA: STAS domain-containing protein [Streptosporangiaceae bacterium]